MGTSNQFAEKAAIDDPAFTLTFDTTYEDISEHFRRYFSKEEFETRKIIALQVPVEGTPDAIRDFIEAHKQFLSATDREHILFSEGGSLDLASGKICISLQFRTNA